MAEGEDVWDWLDNPPDWRAVAVAKLKADAQQARAKVLQLPSQWITPPPVPTSWHTKKKKSPADKRRHEKRHSLAAVKPSEDMIDYLLALKEVKPEVSDEPC